MKRVLYIVSTYYHGMIACIKQLADKKDADMMCTDYIPCSEELAHRAEKSGLFRNVFCVGAVNEYKAKNKLDYIFNLHRKNAELIESQVNIPFADYDEINIFHDDIWAAHYLKDKRLKYRLIEDALDSFKTIAETKFSYMLPKPRARAFLKRLLGIGYVFCGYDPCTYEVEVNDAEGVEIADFAADKLAEVPRKALFDALSEADIKLLGDIFLKEIPTFNAEECVLLLTQPLYIDGLVQSGDEQTEIYRRLVSENADGRQLVIKPHPRDMTDYSAAFPNAVILDKNMPSEILQLAGADNFSKVLSINSSGQVGF